MLQIRHNYFYTSFHEKKIVTSLSILSSPHIIKTQQTQSIKVETEIDEIHIYIKDVPNDV